MTDGHYIVAGKHDWVLQAFESRQGSLPGKWSYCSTPEELDRILSSGVCPERIFFIHWSWRVSSDLLSSTDCICFHMTDLPFGRGGSPLQNLILRGLDSTMLTALRMTDSIDAGPVYMKRELSLTGSAQQIYMRVSALAMDMALEIIESNPEAIPQEGEPTMFERRRPSDSELPNVENMKQLYDFIRMLDAEGYPHAFIDRNGLRIEFTNATLQGDSIVASAKVEFAEKD
ncbi:MAG: methionyl-tRNA formyltransferase [Phycisphaerae bacterium]|nr:methionyl-tRNA formyltransferase [Phycisphaerae bacterium]|tara:strand:- start:14061 stop:14750 length:690 start_codon:yes stop_codon:yes gene_type:complete